MRGLAIVLAALLPCVASAQSLDDGVTGGQSVVASRYQWGSTGGDWPVPPEALAPIVDCRGDFRSGACGATQFTPSGSPGLASTYWRPGGGAVAGSGVAFGSGAYLTATTPVSVEQPTTMCWEGAFDSVAAGFALIAGRWGAQNQWVFYRNGTAMSVGIGGLSGETNLSIGTVTVGISNTLCWSYTPTTDGASTLLANFSGNAYSSTTAKLARASTDAMKFGGYSGYTGTSARFTIWSGWAATAADLARMVRSQYASQGSLGEPLTVTRASAKTCSIGGQWFTVPANQPCIGDAGLSVEGSRTQYALNNCTAPADQTVTLAAGAHTLWLEGSGSVAAAVGTATATGLPCTATASSACSFTVSVGGTVTLDADGAVDRMQVENGAQSSLICATTTPVTRAADVLSVPIPAGALWAVYTLDGTRTVLDLTGNTTPLTIGVGKELAITGNVTNLLFCYSPDSSECI